MRWLIALELSIRQRRCLLARLRSHTQSHSARPVLPRVCDLGVSSSNLPFRTLFSVRALLACRITTHPWGIFIVLGLLKASSSGLCGWRSCRGAAVASGRERARGRAAVGWQIALFKEFRSEADWLCPSKRKFISVPRVAGAYSVRFTIPEKKNKLSQKYWFLSLWMLCQIIILREFSVAPYYILWSRRRFIYSCSLFCQPTTGA